MSGVELICLKTTLHQLLVLARTTKEKGTQSHKHEMVCLRMSSTQHYSSVAVA